MPRILIVNHAAELGGAEHGLLDIAAHFGPARCHVVLFADGPLRARLADIGIATTLLAAPRGLLRVRREDGWRALTAMPSVLFMVLRLAWAARGYDVLYVNSQKAALVGMLAGLLTGRPVVWHLRDILSPAHFSGLQRRAVVWLANLAARRVIAISEATQQAFVACGGDPRRVAVVPNGIDAARFAGIDALEAAALRVGMAPAGAPVVGLFGRITPWKGQHVLISALPDLPDVHAVIVGDALFGEVAYRHALHALAERLGVAGRVHWLGHRGDIPTLMRMVDLVVHTSVAPEPFGRVIVEALLAGRPVLASDQGGPREVLGKESPWLVAPENPPALAGAIRRTLAAPPGDVAASVQAARVRVRGLFDVPQMLRRIERVVAEAT
jgi:glycosyltransferase involved in cell wall biosynthesis